MGGDLTGLVVVVLECEGDDSWRKIRWFPGLMPGLGCKGASVESSLLVGRGGNSKRIMVGCGLCGCRGRLSVVWRGVGGNGAGDGGQAAGGLGFMQLVWSRGRELFDCYTNRLSFQIARVSDPRNRD